jgi:transcriptional regulator with XRE-family HTH domain
MANVKTSPKDRDKILEYADAGLSYSEISTRMGISKSQIGKIVARKRDGKKDDSKEKQELIQKAVDLKIAKETILNETGLAVHDELVNERTAHLKFINNATYININRMLKKFNPKSKEYQAEMSVMDHKLAQSTIKDGRESLLGKEASSQTNIQMNNTSNEVLQKVEIIAVQPDGSSS